MSWRCVASSFLLLFINLLVFCLGTDSRAFDDSIHYDIEWPGQAGEDILEKNRKYEDYTIVTADQEKYTCSIPELIEEEEVEQEEYTGPNPIQLLSLLFSQNLCSYKLEPYWTYELCHGRYVQQYHEERDGKKVKVQQFELGKYSSLQIKKLSLEYDKHAKNPNRKSEIPVKKIDGVNMPYVEVEMTDGTQCDLNDKPRSIKVLYVCYQPGKQDNVQTCR